VCFGRGRFAKEGLSEWKETKRYQREKERKREIEKYREEDLYITHATRNLHNKPLPLAPTTINATDHAKYIRTE